MALAWGEHVQNLLGVTKRLAQPATGQAEGLAAALATRAALQAECYGGVWFYYATKRHHLEAGERDEAAKLAGNDAARAGVTSPREPSASGRGTAEQRERWFRKGAASGDPRLCDTFTAPSL
jgi:predicted metalloprotease